MTPLALILILPKQTVRQINRNFFVERVENMKHAGSNESQRSSGSHPDRGFKVNMTIYFRDRVLYLQ